MKTLLNKSELGKLNKEAFNEYCEEFSQYCDLTQREHRIHAGDLLKLTIARFNLDPVLDLANALIVS